MFVTVDRNLPFQQRLDNRPFATVVLMGRSTRVTDLIPLVPRLIELIPTLAAGTLTRIAAPSDS